MTGFVGRELELAHSTALLERTRLLTLTGPGGCGKTRLALRLAELLWDEHEGVGFASLESVRDPERVAVEVAAALGYRDSGGVEARIEAIGERRLLLVLDNCEHVVDEAASLAARLLAACGRLVILATSREALNIPGEIAWKVPSLSLPPEDLAAPGDVLAASDAVRLFAERAFEHNPSFRLDGANQEAVVAVCRHLDGIPLALELAAARAASMSVEEIVQRLRESFRLLTGGSRTAVERHQTLRATMDWSYNLLDPKERLLFARLAVFAGGFELEAAEAVTAGGELQREEIADGLGRLVAKSMVQADTATSPTRYRLSDPLRQYAQELCRTEIAGLRRRHARHYADLAERGPEAYAGDRARRVGRLLEELDNLRSAFDWLIEDDPLLYWRLCMAMDAVWWSRGSVLEGVRRLAEGLERCPLEPGERLLGLRRLSGLQGRAAQSEAALATAVEALRLADEAGDQTGRAQVLASLVIVHGMRGDFAEARRCAEESLRLDPDPPLLPRAALLNDLAIVAAADGSLDEALQLVGRSLELGRQLDLPSGLAAVLHTKAVIHLQLGQPAQARRCAEEAIEAALGQKDGSRVASNLELLAEAELRAHRPEHALELLAAAQRLRLETGFLGSMPSSLQNPARSEHEARAQLAKGQADAAWTRGQSIPFERLGELAVGATDATASLSARERECAAFVAAGLTNKEIARRLGIGVRTVETHLDNVRLKLDFRTRSEIAAWAAASGLSLPRSVPTP